MTYKGIELHNAAELIDAGQIIDADDVAGHIMSRLPDTLRLKLNEGAQNSALQAAGCEMRFRIESKAAKIKLRSLTGPSIAEIYQGCFPVSWHVVETEPTAISVSLPDNIGYLERLSKERGYPFDAGLTRLMLPHRPSCVLMDIEGDLTGPRRGQVPAVRYLTYGSSITHGASAVRPSGTYAMLTARSVGADLVNLGLGGGAHLEGDIADYIASRTDWDLASLEMGILKSRRFIVRLSRLSSRTKKV